MWLLNTVKIKIKDLVNLLEPHFRCLLPTCGWWLLYWTVEISQITITVMGTFFLFSFVLCFSSTINTTSLKWLAFNFLLILYGILPQKFLEHRPFNEVFVESGEFIFLLSENWDLVCNWKGCRISQYCVNC